MTNMASYPRESNHHAWVYAANSEMSTIGLPVAVQLTAPPFREELCLMAMRELDTVVKDRRRDE